MTTATSDAAGTVRNLVGHFGAGRVHLPRGRPIATHSARVGLALVTVVQASTRMRDLATENDRHHNAAGGLDTFGSRVAVGAPKKRRAGMRYCNLIGLPEGAQWCI